MPTIAGFLITNFANADRIVGFNDPHLGGLACHEAELMLSPEGHINLRVGGCEALMQFKPKIGWPGRVYLIRRETYRLAVHAPLPIVTLELVYQDTP